MEMTTSTPHSKQTQAPAQPASGNSKDSWFRIAIRGKTRIAIAWIFGIALVLTARDYPNLAGIFVCWFGATIRFWASGFLRKDMKPAVGGPYRYTRNPLYLGTYLMALGTALAIENWWLLGATTVVFAVIYHFIILDEETKLEGLLGAAYLRYKQLVRRFFPGLPASRDQLQQVNDDRESYRFDWTLAMGRNKAYEAYAAFLALIGGVALIAALWQNVLGPYLGDGGSVM